MNEIKRHLEQSQAPYNAQIDQVLPGVHSRMDSMGSNLNYVRENVEKHQTQMELMPSTIHEVLHFFWDNAMKAVTMASSLLGGNRGRRRLHLLQYHHHQRLHKQKTQCSLLQHQFVPPLVMGTVSQQNHDQQPMCGTHGMELDHTRTSQCMGAFL